MTAWTWTFMKRFQRRPPDYYIGGRENPYVLRWYVIPRNRWFNIYLHKICRSDDDRALHDHPWISLSIILRGSYREIRQTGYRDCSAGSIVLRVPTFPHRLEVERPCWSLFLTGPKVREWGFWCPKSWVHWQKFVDEKDSGNIGRGCGEFA